MRRFRSMVATLIALSLAIVPAHAGAYAASMASNYNLLPRPAAVMVAEGEARLVQRRESVDDLLARDV